MHVDAANVIATEKSLLQKARRQKVKNRYEEGHYLSVVFVLHARDCNRHTIAILQASLSHCR